MDLLWNPSSPQHSRQGNNQETLSKNHSYFIQTTKAAFELIGEENMMLSDKWKRYLHKFGCIGFGNPTTLELQNHYRNEKEDGKPQSYMNLGFNTIRISCKRSRVSCGEEAVVN